MRRQENRVESIRKIKIRLKVNKLFLFTLSNLINIFILIHEQED